MISVISVMWVSHKASKSWSGKKKGDVRVVGRCFKANEGCMKRMSDVDSRLSPTLAAAELENRKRLQLFMIGLC